MTKCFYRGPLCVVNGTVSLTKTQRMKNVSCADEIEYCGLSQGSTENDNQCFSIFEVVASGVRVEDRSGCTPDVHPKLCTPRSCNFSHAVVHPRNGRVFHYCCCNTEDLCNDGIIGWRKPTEATTQPLTGEFPQLEYCSEPLSKSKGWASLVCK